MGDLKNLISFSKVFALSMKRDRTDVKRYSWLVMLKIGTSKNKYLNSYLVQNFEFENHPHTITIRRVASQIHSTKHKELFFNDKSPEKVFIHSNFPIKTHRDN